MYHTQPQRCHLGPSFEMGAVPSSHTPLAPAFSQVFLTPDRLGVSSSPASSPGSRTSSFWDHKISLP